MKLNYKRVILVGFAFFIISAFWQSYDNVMPLILTNKFGLNQTISGIIMALDNVLAVFLLPLFGSLSDKTNSRYGKRTPFIVIGCIAAVIAYLFIPVINDLWLFILVLLLVLVAMAVFRSPAVALMPDVTVKPYRSKANAVINLMGTAGGIIVLALGMIFGTGSVKNSMMSYTPFFAIIAGVMLAALGLFMITVREPKFSDEMRQQSKRLNLDETDEETSGKKKLSRGEKTSLILILASVALWYMGYNAVTSKYSVYAGKVLNLDYNSTLMIANIAAIVSYIPVGAAASKIGRKKTILGGVVMLASAFGVAAFLREGSSALLMNCMFALAGIGWATINVNSFPMVVEMCSGGEVGKFTGYYYTASMAAQVLTPYLSGLLMDKIGMTSLFPYATCFVALAFAAMLFVKHGDSRPQARSGIEALNYED